MRETTTKEDRVVFGLDDATPHNIDAATIRRMKMWEKLNTNISKLSVSIDNLKTILMINIGIQLVIAAIQLYNLIG